MPSGNEAFQKASIENQSYSAMQQKMSQAAKALVKGFNFGAYSSASNTVKQSMQASVAVSNEVSQECGSSNAGVNKVMQTCDGIKVEADGSKVKSATRQPRKSNSSTRSPSAGRTRRSRTRPSRT